MLYQAKFIVPAEITSADLAREIAHAELSDKIASLLRDNITLHHRADFDRIIYYMEMICVDSDDFRDIMSKLSWLYQNNFSHQHRDMLWDIKTKLKKGLDN